MPGENENNESNEGLLSIDDEMAEFDEFAGEDVTFDDNNETADDDNDTDEEATDEEGSELEEETDEETDIDDEEDEDTEESEEDEDDTEEDNEDDEVDEDDDDNATDSETIIANLRKQLAEQAAKPPVTQQQQAATEAEIEDETQEVLTDFVFATEDNFEEILESPEAFNNAVNAGLKVVLEQANKINQQNAIQAIQTSIPGMIHTQVARERTTMDAVNSFYEAHPKLADFKPLVGGNVTTLQSENPELTLSEIMDKAAKRTYKQLELSDKAVDKSTSGKKVRKPAKNTGLRKKGKQGSKRKSNFNKSKVSEFQAELDELN